MMVGHGLGLDLELVMVGSNNGLESGTGKRAVTAAKGQDVWHTF
jgi:hypothetical protein